MIKFGKETSLFMLGLVAACFVLINAQAQPDSSVRPQAFTHLDKDGDGLISAEEYVAFREQRMAARSAKGKHMRGAANLPSFTDIDSNVDGQLDPVEFAAARKAHRENLRAMRMSHGKGSAPGKMAGSGKGAKANMPGFSDFDLDGDGTIIETEFNQAHAKRMSDMAKEGRHMKHAKDAPGFSAIDSDSDGGISEEEFAAHQAEHHRRMHGHTDQTD